MAIELGAVSIDHLDTISDEEIQLLGMSATIGVITPAVNAVRRALPSALTLTPFEVADDLISTVDLALAARQMPSAG